MKIFYTVWAAPETITPAAVAAIEAAALAARFSAVEVEYEGEAIALIGDSDDTAEEAGQLVRRWVMQQWPAAGMKPLELLWCTEAGRAGRVEI